MKHGFKIDYWLLCPVAILILIGLTTLASINMVYLRGQIISLAIAVFIFLIITQIDFEIFATLKKPIYISALVLLFIVLLLGIESRGAVRWIEFFGIRVQFSETYKPLLSLALASQMANIRENKFKIFLQLILFLLPVVLLIYLQPDLGNALIYTGVFFCVLLVIGYPLHWFSAIILVVGLASPLLWTILHEYQRQRILTFITPHADPLGKSYNSIQSLIAVGSGMFLGKGLGEGTQSVLKFLPERHTDFMYATISEEMGFVGSSLVIIAFAFLFYRIYKIFVNSEGQFERIFLACTFLFLFLQFFLNIGMNIGILPVVGVTLPFLSYGGSSLVSNFIFLAIASSISISQKKREVLEIR